MPPDVQSRLHAHAEATDAYLCSRLPTVACFADAPPRLVEAINYSLLGPGKRLRPALVLESAAVCPAVAAPSALPAAAAIELIHTFSLVHDDLPAMDDDDLRRSRATNHKIFGEALAILAGDAMTTLAFELLAVEYRDQPSVAVALVAELARAAGPAGMIGGQVLDMAGEGTTLSAEALRDVHRRKTGALMVCACRMGAIVAGADGATLAALTAYGLRLGLAFQIADDLLDVSASPQITGKATNKDATAGKNTYPALLGVDEARAAARIEAEAAVSALDPVNGPTDGLAQLAWYAVSRDR